MREDAPMWQKAQLLGQARRNVHRRKDFNNGDLPDHIFIYRDGVGDSMR
jgi:predicted Zn-dependent protease with MMP-like domain